MATPIITRAHPSLRLSLLPRPFFVKQAASPPTEVFAALAATPDPDSPPRFLSITRAAEEWSIVGECAHDGNEGTEGGKDMRKEEARWRCIRVAGPMDLGLTGILCDLSMPLKRAGVPIFAVSTWNTDYVLVPKDKVAEAIEALRADGWSFDTSVPPPSDA